ncbi:MAG TPA: Abi family protein [Pseudomonadota bacterium]|nr:Abi family protein [Pseudomonadota bacterium]
MKYDKPGLTAEQQIDQLRERGMAFGDVGRATHYLRELNYYRLSGYWLRLEQDHGSHTFKPGAVFEDVLADYVFDRELKLLVLDAVERVEVSIRTRWAHILGLRHGAHAHLDGTLFKPRSQQWNHPTAVGKLVQGVEQSRERFIRHLRETYDELLPPIWAAVEVMSLGQISSWFSNLRHAADRNAVAEGYGLDEVLLASFLHHISVVRNICAHHARLWDRGLHLKAQLPRKHPDALVSSLNHGEGGSIYNTRRLGKSWVSLSISCKHQSGSAASNQDASTRSGFDACLADNIGPSGEGHALPRGAHGFSQRAASIA